MNQEPSQPAPAIEARGINSAIREATANGLNLYARPLLDKAGFNYRIIRAEVRKGAGEAAPAVWLKGITGTWLKREQCALFEQ